MFSAIFCLELQNPASVFEGRELKTGGGGHSNTNDPNFIRNFDNF